MDNTTAAEAQAANTTAGNTLTLSTGVVLRLKRPSAWALTEVQRQMAREAPKPPVVYNADKDREEPNESDPRYWEALAEHATRLTERLYEVVIATGTEIASLPDGFPGPDDPIWRENLEAVGIELPPPDRKRPSYIAWIKYVAAPVNEDWQALYAPLLRQIGTAEEDVAAALAAFRGNTERGADRGSAAPGDGGDGD